MSDPVDSTVADTVVSETVKMEEVVLDKIDDVKEVLSDIVEKGHDALVFVNKIETEVAPKVVPWFRRLAQLFHLCRSAQSVKVASPPGDEPPALEPSH